MNGMSSSAETASDTDSSNVQKQSIKEYVAQRKAQKENPNQTISEYKAQRKAQAEQHQKDMVQQEEQYKKDLAEYEKQKAEYERQVRQLEAEKQAEEERIAQEKAESEKIKADRQAITDRYDSQIQDIQRQKESSLVFKSWTGKQPYLHNSTPVIRPDGTRTTHRGWVPRGYKIGKYVPPTQSRIRHLNGRINSLKHQQREELNRYDAQAYPSWARRGWSSSSFPDTSLAEYAQRKIDAKNAEAEARRRSSIKNAQSNAIKARENHEKTVREFESRRDSLGIKLNEGQMRLAQIKEPQKTTRTRPKIHSSSYFSEVENTPVSILGTNLAKSRQAEETFEITQTQQRQLHQKVTGASSWNEAVKLRKEAMELNPHVGTANSHFYKDDLIGSSGVLIEKKPKIQRGLEQYSVTIDGKTRTFNTKETADKFIARYESIKYPTTLGQYYTVQTPDGNITRKFESFSEARKYQQELNRTLDIEADIYKEYDKSYIGFSPDGQPIHGPPAPAELTPNNKKDSKNLISPNEIPIQEYNVPIFVDVKQQRRAEEIRVAGGTYGDYLKTLDKNTLDYQLKEIGLGAKRAYHSYTGLVGYNLVNPQTHGRSLLDSIFHDAIKYVENPNDHKSYSTTLHAIKSRSPAQHAGDLITTGAIEAGVFLATGGIGNLAIRGAGKIPYLLKSKPESVTQYLKHQKDADLGYLKAQELAERMFSSSKELRVAEQLEADVIFRRKPERLAKAIRQSNKETPVGIEKISDNSYLISAGTESKESLPMVLYRIGKNSKSTVFSPVKPDDVITPKNILVKGNSKNELSGTEKLAKDVSVAPGNAKNLEKISDNTIDNFLKPESILTDVPNSFLEKYPKVAVHGAAQSDIPSSVYVTTEQRNPLRGFNADVKKLDAPDSLGKNTDTARFKDTVRDIVETEDRGRLDRNLGDKSTTPKPSKTNSKAAPPKPSNTKEILEPAKVKTTQNTKSVKTQSDVSVVDEILHPSRPKIKDKPVLNSAVKQGQRDRTITDIVSDVKPEHQHDPFLDDMIKHQQKTDAMSGPKQKLNPPEIKKKDTDSILFDLLVKPVMQTKQKPDYGVVFVPYSSTPPDDILIPTTTSKPPVPQGAKVTRRNETSSRTGRGLKRRRHEFLGNTRQDSILGIYNRSEVIYGDKKVRRTERRDAKTVRDSSKRKDREILPKAKSEDIDILGGRKSETDIILRNRKSQKEILPKPRPKKDVDILKPSKSSSKNINFLGGGKSKKGKKSEFDGWF